MYVPLHSLSILGSPAGTKRDLGWAAFPLQAFGAAEMLKCFSPSHLPQLEPQGLPAQCRQQNKAGTHAMLISIPPARTLVLNQPLL